MKITKLGSLLVASLFVFNSFGQKKQNTLKQVPLKSELVQRELQTPEQKAKMQTDRLEKQLLLSNDQIAKIYETNLAVNMKNDAVQTHPTWTKEQKLEAFEGNKNGRTEVIKTFLTPEQLIKFETPTLERDTNSLKMY